MDDFRPGYPRYTFLLSSYPAFQNFRRFSRTRMRLLLVKQDEIAILEKSLDTLDATEDRELFLGCVRMDQNSARQEVLHKLKAAISEYGN